MDFSQLTDRQRTVAAHCARGNSTNEIAYRLGISVGTVNVHYRNIRAILEIRRVRDLIAYREELERLLLADVYRNSSDYQGVGSKINAHTLVRPLLQLTRRGEPILEQLAEEVTSSEIVDLANKIRPTLKEDDWCCAVNYEPNFSDQRVRYLPMKYSIVRAHREMGRRLRLLSSNALILCPERAELILHRRSGEVDEYPNSLHTIGGCVIPEGYSSHGDRDGVRDAVIREIREETRLDVGLIAYAPKVTINEFGIDFIQSVSLGLRVNEQQCDQMISNWEGKIERVPFFEVSERLRETCDWTPSGWVHVMLWLGYGCPGTLDLDLELGGGRPEQLFHEILGAKLPDFPPRARAIQISKQVGRK